MFYSNYKNKFNLIGEGGLLQVRSFTFKLLRTSRFQNLEKYDLSLKKKDSVTRF